MSVSGLLTPISPHIQHTTTVVLIQRVLFFLCLYHAFLWPQSIKQDFDAAFFTSTLNLRPFFNGCHLTRFK